MYAVIETGGKQYRVAPGDVIDVERGPAVDDEGAVRFERVLMVGGDGSVEVGRPVVEGALVRASLVGEVRGPKIRVFKMKRRKGYRRTAGHRQDLLRLKIDGIDTGGEAGPKAKTAKAAKATTEAASKAAKATAEAASDAAKATTEKASKAAKPVAKAAKSAAGTAKSATAKKPGAKKAATEKPAAKKAATKEPAAKKPATKTTATKAKAKDKPAESEE